MPVCACICTPSSFLNKWMDFHKTWHEQPFVSRALFHVSVLVKESLYLLKFALGNLPPHLIRLHCVVLKHRDNFTCFYLQIVFILFKFKLSISSLLLQSYSITISPIRSCVPLLLRQRTSAINAVYLLFFITDDNLHASFVLISSLCFTINTQD
jgi:hypothetical protein